MILNGQLKYRPDIDGLRAIAVLSVIVYHAYPLLLPGAFIGVDIFFVISGYLISGIIFTGLPAETFSLKDFYIRRIKRIFPGLILVLLAALVMGWFVLLEDEFLNLSKHVVAGAAFVSNIIYWQEIDYFNKASELKPLLHLWSLGIEEQFYVIWPPLIYLAWKRGWNLAYVLWLIMITSFCLNVWAVTTCQQPHSTFQ